MKILALSDIVDRTVYSPQICDLCGDIDLVIGCGDLPYYYLEYIVTMLKVPVVYVHGNHDRPQYTYDGCVVSGAQGCKFIDGRTIRIGDLLLAGLGGSISYQPNATNQYTDAEMRARILRLIPALVQNRARYGRYLDILVAHSPPRGIHDGEDRAHRGFESFLQFMRAFKPRYLLHGHKHVYRREGTLRTQYHDTTVINVYPRRVIEWEQDEV